MSRIIILAKSWTTSVGAGAGVGAGYEGEREEGREERERERENKRIVLLTHHPKPQSLGKMLKKVGS